MIKRNYCKKIHNIKTCTKANAFSTNYLLIVAIAYLIVSIGYSAYHTSNLISLNEEFNELYSKKITEEKEISDLAYSLSNLTSLSRLENKAQSLGFLKLDKNVDVIDIIGDQPVAYLDR